tara:strand:+ start:846 stop:1169 length:324 start_codon:yes stop_codon:yes gene_type:complete
MKKRILLVSIFIITLIYSFETYLILTSENLKGEPRSEFFKKTKRINKEVQLVVNPSFYLNKKNKTIPLSGISNAETIYCNENGYYSIYKSDRFGFNNPDKEWDKKKN